jgi:hypothetical protein
MLLKWGMRGALCQYYTYVFTARWSGALITSHTHCFNLFYFTLTLSKYSFGVHRRHLCKRLRMFFWLYVGCAKKCASYREFMHFKFGLGNRLSRVMFSRFSSVHILKYRSDGLTKSVLFTITFLSIVYWIVFILHPGFITFEYLP